MQQKNQTTTYDLKKHTTFKIGCFCSSVFFPENLEELCELLKEHKNAIVLGNASNVLVSSFGFEKPVIFTKNLNKIHQKDDKIVCETGVLGTTISKLALENAKKGFEFLIGFPSTVGGAVKMNASCHNQSVSDIFLEGSFFSIEDKTIIGIKKEDMNFSYRQSILENGKLVLLEATFDFKDGEKEKIEETMKRNIEFRQLRQPSLKLANVGSIFKNPMNDSAGRLLDLAGCKTLKINGACVWENHANFIVNIDDATSEDVLNLMWNMKKMVFEKYRINLMPEIEYLGTNSEREKELWKNLHTELK